MNQLVAIQRNVFEVKPVVLGSPNASLSVASVFEPSMSPKHIERGVLMVCSSIAPKQSGCKKVNLKTPTNFSPYCKIMLPNIIIFGLAMHKQHPMPTQSIHDVHIPFVDVEQILATTKVAHHAHNPP